PNPDRPQATLRASQKYGRRETQPKRWLNRRRRKLCARGGTPMTVTRTNTIWRGSDHFEPDAGLDPQAQKRLRGALEQIDYIAYATSKEVAAAALESAEAGQPLTAREVDELVAHRRAFEEATEVYEALRHLVERGYLPYT